MFGLASSGSSFIDVDEERAPPPHPTLVYFPQNDLDVHDFQTDADWAKHIPNLFERYSHITKPNDITIDHLRALNLVITSDVPLEQLVPSTEDGQNYLPPVAVASNPASRRSSTVKIPVLTVSGASGQKQQLLSNGHKVPDLDMYLKYAAELTCENEDAFRVLARKKARPGHPAPHLSHFRRFWGGIEVMSTYWDSSLDHYYEVGDNPERPRPKSPRGLKRLSLALNIHSHSEAPAHGTRYKGKRLSTGSKMPEMYRSDVVRSFVEPFAWAFGCMLMNPKKTPQMEIGKLRLPVTQTAVMWRHSKDKALSKKGITEGPLLGLQCRGETGFMKDKHAAGLDAAREIAGLLLLAEERAREGKTPIQPGEGEWYTTKPRWGGLPGGEFGDKEGNTDQPPPIKSGVATAPDRRHVNGPQIRYVPKIRGRTGEEIWKELKPSPSLWDPRHTYLAVGKDRTRPFDNVFMISALFHHVAILKLTVHPLYIDFLVTGNPPKNTPPGVAWFQPKIERSRWYDLLNPEDRAEAFRGVWGVMGYMMRSGESAQTMQGDGRRQKSDSHQHHFSFRKKPSDLSPGDSAQRSSSVAF